MEKDCIIIKGARVNNLKNIDVNLPRGKFIVITGLSGSGKSSLAFDTLYAEGQRRYVESLSSYARQFMGRLTKPECDYIKGLPPAIAIEQRVNTRNSRSTVGTSTEIYDYLRLLFARIGVTYSPISGDIVKKHTSQDVMSTIYSYPAGCKMALLCNVLPQGGRTIAQQLEVLAKGGYSRLELDGYFMPISDVLAAGVDEDHFNHHLLIDRFISSETHDDDMRILDSLSTAFYEGKDECTLMVVDGNNNRHYHTFSKKFEADGMTFQEPNDLMFNFNNPLGACPTCEGFGKIMGIDENLVVPNKSLSVYDDAVMCWRGNVMSEWKREFIHLASRYDFPIHKPYFQLTDEQKRLLWDGADGFPGINGFFNWIKSKSYSIQYRVLLARYRGKTDCPDCHGSRLKPEALYVKINGMTIADLVQMPIERLATWFNNLTLSDNEQLITKRLLTEIKHRLQYLVDVGLGYLTLDRRSSSLSGGESQRINLATSLGSSLMGSVYILDEPSIGLHSRDTYKLISVLRQLKEAGNTVVVVEHDEEIIRAADYLIDIGPEAGRLGGEVVYQGDVNKLHSSERSYTSKYLTGVLSIPIPKIRRKWSNYIEVKGAAENNLKGIDVKFPLNVMTVVTGVSGSGKSTLVDDVLYRSLARHFDIAVDSPGAVAALEGDLNLIKNVEFVDQNPIGKSTRSNPATYLKAFDEIRQLYASQQLSKQMGYGPGFFSFNAQGGRCEDCKGEGTVTIEMQFMADIVLTCETCHGKRFNHNALEVTYRGKNIHDILEMTVNQAIEFFSQEKTANEKRIVARLKPLQDVGLGYIKLGQSSSTLSGGENQRVKLASYLAGEKHNATLYIFDEPTTGLHFHDINKLLESMNRLVDNGHTVIIIEHNIDVIKCADHVIDLGPDGGNRGGEVVATGTPEQIAACPSSFTGKFLKQKLEAGR
ncbi:MAG: excinuclease ABC subunit UvrA [Muribaculaceae bacterium]|nr:excinuclease ABC subunit UvrA [Muribaculaceae bacterium]